jgi:hypothetical protein
MLDTHSKKSFLAGSDFSDNPQRPRGSRVSSGIIFSKHSVFRPHYTVRTVRTVRIVRAGIPL